MPQRETERKRDRETDRETDKDKVKIEDRKTSRKPTAIELQHFATEDSLTLSQDAVKL